MYTFIKFFLIDLYMIDCMLFRYREQRINISKKEKAVSQILSISTHIQKENIYFYYSLLYNDAVSYGDARCIIFVFMFFLP